MALTARRYESATEGDSFILSFHDAASAVAWAVEAQVGLGTGLPPPPSSLLTCSNLVALLLSGAQSMPM